MEFDEPVAVGGDGNVRLRLDVGTDDTNQGNSRKTVSTYSVLHNGQTLRFVYTVAGHDTNPNLRDRDADGVWVQTNAGGTAVFLPANADPAISPTLTHAVTGEDADLTAGWLPTTGDPLHKVDGSKDDDDIGPLPSSATVDGDTLTVTFDTNLAAPADADALRFDFLVRGAGGIGADDKAHSQSPSTVAHGTGTDADKLTLTLGAPAQAGETVTLTYTGKTLKGAGTNGKKAPMFRGLAVTNDTSGTAGPALLHASVEGQELRMVFDAALDTASLPAGSAFFVEATDPDEDVRILTGTGTATIDGAVGQGDAGRGDARGRAGPRVLREAVLVAAQGLGIRQPRGAVVRQLPARGGIRRRGAEAGRRRGGTDGDVTGAVEAVAVFRRGAGQFLGAGHRGFRSAGGRQRRDGLDGRGRGSIRGADARPAGGVGDGVRGDLDARDAAHPGLGGQLRGAVPADGQRHDRQAGVPVGGRGRQPESC